MSIHEDGSGVFWIGTWGGGLNKFDPKEEEFIHYQNDVDDPHSLSNNSIGPIYEDRSGVLWIGTNGGGLNKFDREKETFTHYRKKDGLPNDIIYGILEDNQGNLWLSTNKGLSKFNPRTQIFNNYDVEDGLQSNEFNGMAYHKNRSGEMFFGGLKGFNAFYPDSVKDNPFIPPIVITDLQIFNEPVGIKDDSPLRKHITETEEIMLSYKDNVFSFEFAALNFTNPKKNQYKYLMEGFDEDWISSGTRRFVTYTNLDPGEYVFRVKGSNNDGLWNEEGASVKIIITPPFWETWWFRALSAMLVIGLAFTGYYRRLKNVRMKTELQAAHDAQMSIMPQTDPQIEGFDISGVCIPAQEVGGDFFDYIWLDKAKTRLAIVVGDVSGKAMAAAMTAVMSSGIVNSEAHETNSVKDILTRVNHPLYSKTDKQMFVALCLAVVDIDKNELIFANAGSIKPLLKSDGSVAYIKAAGPTYPLGIVENTIYQEKRVLLKSKDVLILLTDGIPEAQNRARELYGEERLKNLVEEIEVTPVSAKETKEKIIEDVRRFSGTAPQHDDMTVVVVKLS
jgi:serine phosphatase RsbU (regulator of sigma subunit)